MLNSEELINKVKIYNIFFNPEKLNKAYDLLRNNKISIINSIIIVEKLLDQQYNISKNLKKFDEIFICNDPSRPPIHTDYLWNGARTTRAFCHSVSTARHVLK